MATIGDDGALTLRLRLPNCLAEEYGKYVVIAGVQFAYGHEQVLAALGSNAEYTAYRCEHGDKAARATALGQDISYRFKRDAEGWRVFVSTEMMDVPFVTDRRQGAIRRAPECGSSRCGGYRRQWQLSEGLADAAGDLRSAGMHRSRQDARRVSRSPRPWC